MEVAREPYHGHEEPEVEPAAARDQLVPDAPLAEDPASDDVRLFPIVSGDLCYRVVALLARGRLEEAGRLVPDSSWVASLPLHG